jgi:uncharacterized protein (DUF488 family)
MIGDVEEALRVFTLGHSNRPIDELLGLLAEHCIERLVDIRRFPVSRRFPQFEGGALAEILGCAGIAYVHEPDLGGRREPRPGSPNTAWRNPAFRGYADHMDTEVFRAALGRVIAAAEATTAVLCAEREPSDCHRQLVADALVVRGVQVVHVLAAGAPPEPHRLHRAAQLHRGSLLRYPAPAQIPLDLGSPARRAASRKRPAGRPPRGPRRSS